MDINKEIPVMVTVSYFLHKINLKTRVYIGSQDMIRKFSKKWNPLSKTLHSDRKILAVMWNLNGKPTDTKDLCGR